MLVVPKTVSLHLLSSLLERSAEMCHTHTLHVVFDSLKNSENIREHNRMLDLNDIHICPLIVKFKEIPTHMPYYNIKFLQLNPQIGSKHVAVLVL